jgi:hypothetical protein
MRKNEQRILTNILFLAFIWGVFLTFVHHADAYTRYNDGCTNCHGAFTSGTSPKGSNSGNNNKMDMHTSKDYMGNNCNLCHSSGPKSNPYIGASRGTSENPGLGCTGCHGREEDAGNDSVSPGRGAGLRQHHWNADRVIDTANGPVSTRVCEDCHSDSNPANYTPVGEHVMPVYYGTGDTNVDEPCNPVAQANINQNWTVGDFIGLDDDGDGLYDLNDPDCGGLPLCTDSDNDGYVDCDGTCAPGTLICGDCNDGDGSFNPDAPELCDGLDNNCNNSIDEDFTNLGTSCTAGVGACEATGSFICTVNGLGTECDATPGTPTAELCDGLDNDCDNSIDEDFPNLDTVCTVGVGACEGSGNYICTVDGIGTECDATPGTPGVEGPPADPNCIDLIDNDCDGTTDAEDPDCSSCIPTGQPDSNCDGVDDDCDGTPDDGYVPVPCGLGACTSSSQCIDGTEIPCQPGPPAEPSDVTCDGLDGDCDGAVDEDYISTSTSCGVGECASTGQTACVGGVEDDTCSPGAPGIEGPEGDLTCEDTVDNDCDGSTDEGDSDCSYIPPPVRQELGRPDSAFNDLVTEDCRFCHENPDQFPVEDETIPNRHHLLVDTQVRSGTCSQTPAIQCQNSGECPVDEFCINGSDAPFPPAPDGIYECLTCHEAICGAACAFIVQRNCMACHLQNPVSEYTVHHRTDLGQGTLPQGPDCQFCHGSLVDNRDDGHQIPTYTPTNETPMPSGGTGLPFNNRGNGAGACDYCHDSGTSIEGIIVETNEITHHNRGYGFDDSKCDWCHDFNLPVEAQIRICENCHGFNTLHSIQADSNGDGIINAGIEDPFYGHIGNPDDCWGCHGYGPPAPTNTDVVVPAISSISPAVLTEGIDTTVDITGSAFTNNDQQGTEIQSDVSLEPEDGSANITLTPDLISQDTMTVTVPGTLSTGNYKLRAVKQQEFSNPKVISIKPEVMITHVDCDKRRGILTITGAGFGDKPAGTDPYINVETSGQIVEAVSWRDDQIRVPVSNCKKKSQGDITVHSLHGEATYSSKWR